MTPASASISIAMATYNGARFIAEQLDSLAEQTVAPHELVVCDDGSTDATLQILTAFAARAPFPLRIIRNETRLGYADNFLKAASLCSGEWIAFCDQDDVWLDTKLSIVSDTIKAHPQAILVSHPAILTDEDLQHSGEIAWPAKDRLHPPLSSDPWTGGMGCGQIFRSFLVKEIPFNQRFSAANGTNGKSPHDYWIGRLACILGSTYSLSKPLVLRRRHRSSVTSARKPPTSSRRRWLKPNFAQQRALEETAKRALDTTKTLRAIIPHSDPKHGSALNSLAAHFEAGHEILLKRCAIRTSTKPSQLRTMLDLTTDRRYWQLGYGFVGKTGIIRDLADTLFSARVRPSK